ncbi:hypothetical protein B0H14DRAFT_2616628 [Mycena olivaceomarginata]|nr:hypothetical protein B0H14DRAFT_2616628 [Mycena olivaceomarginata]
MSEYGWPATEHGCTAFISSLKHAVQQVERQAVALFKLDHSLEERGARQSTVWLVAAVVALARAPSPNYAPPGSTGNCQKDYLVKIQHLPLRSTSVSATEMEIIEKVVGIVQV